MEKAVGARRKMRLLPLLAATYFMVSGGPYGLEDIIGDVGYGAALLILFALPFFWSLPTALMIGELAAAVPEEGGFYAWVRRAMGPFWGFQEAWLSLAASVFDMAIYPTLFVSYLGHLAPVLTAGHRGLLIELAVVAMATAWNLRGAAAVGDGSVWMWLLGLSPFVVLVLGAVWIGLRTPHATLAAKNGADFAGAITVAMWNYMGWDNASTIAGEVEDPQKDVPESDAAGGADDDGDVCGAGDGGVVRGDCAGALCDRGVGGCGAYDWRAGACAGRGGDGGGG